MLRPPRRPFSLAKTGSLAKAAACLAALFAGSAQPASGAESEADSDDIEEIVVTADFRATALMRTPTSASIFGAEEAAEQGARHLEDLLGAAPNVAWASGASRARFLQVRGIGDLEQYAEPKYYPSVGIVVDGLEVGDAANAAMLFDVAQVEVLRGPQGAPFGASGYAGLVNVRTREPSAAPELRLVGGAGSHASRTLGLAAGGALGAGVAARFAAHRSASDGYTTNAHLGRDDTGDFEETALRLKLRFSPREAARYDFGAFLFDSDNGYDAWSLDNERTTYADQPGKDAQRTMALATRGEWIVGDDGLLQGSVNLLESDLHYSYDADWISDAFCVSFLCSSGNDTAAEIFERERRRATADIRLVLSKTVFGVYANDAEERLDYRYPSFWYGDYSSASTYATRRLAAYGEYRHDAGSYSIIAGARVERFQDDYRDGFGFASSGQETLWSGDLRLVYPLAENSIAYVSLARAERPGGINVAASSQRPAMSPVFQTFTERRLAFDAESLLGLEGGLKLRALGERLSLRLAAFAMSRRNAQLETWMWDGDAGLWIGYLDSTSDAKSRGLEAEAELHASDGIALFAMGSLLKTEVDAIEVFDLDVYDFVSKTERRLAKAPSFQYSLGLRLRLAERWRFSAWLAGQDDTYYGYYHDGRIDGYVLANASLTWQREAAQVRLWGRNLGDRTFGTHALYFGADPRDNYGNWSNRTYLQLGPPRSWGVDVELAF